MVDGMTAYHKKHVKCSDLMKRLNVNDTRHRGYERFAPHAVRQSAHISQDQVSVVNLV